MQHALADGGEWRRGVSVHPGDEQQAKAIARAGFDFVRLTIDPFAPMARPSGFSEDAWLGQVEAALHPYRRAGLRVIVDLHPIPKSGGRRLGNEEYASAAIFTEYSGLAARIAARLDTLKDSGLAFEPFNEPEVDCAALDKGSALQWPAMALLLHSAIRLKAPRLTLVLEGACWADARSLASLDPSTFADPNLIWSFHDYAPMVFSHQGASWVAGPSYFAHGLAFPPHAGSEPAAMAQSLAAAAATTLQGAAKAGMLGALERAVADYFKPESLRAQMNAPVETVARWAKAHGVPPSRVLVGEFGALQGSGAGEPSVTSRMAYLSAKRELFEAQGWGWSLWEWRGSFGISSHGAALPVFTVALGLRPKKP
ncbi:MAG: cellulase family glycosylhydrolase [Alphaproteobacteria bacterium]|nr:cellulase family glycosylhydrolase [Alphaproteobacteria bacterium]